MVDTFLFLTIARTGDQLQGIKKGILEIADVIAVNKADGDRAAEAKSAAKELAGALRLVHSSGDGLGAAGAHLLRAARRRRRHGLGAGAGPPRVAWGSRASPSKRAEQQLDFTWALVRDELDQRLRRSPGVKAIRDDVRRELLAGELTAPLAADRLVAAYDDDRDDEKRPVSVVSAVRSADTVSRTPMRRTSSSALIVLLVLASAGAARTRRRRRSRSGTTPRRPRASRRRTPRARPPRRRRRRSTTRATTRSAARSTPTPRRSRPIADAWFAYWDARASSFAKAKVDPEPRQRRGRHGGRRRRAVRGLPEGQEAAHGRRHEVRRSATSS